METMLGCDGLENQINWYKALCAENVLLHRQLLFVSKATAETRRKVSDSHVAALIERFHNLTAHSEIVDKNSPVNEDKTEIKKITCDLLLLVVKEEQRKNKVANCGELVEDCNRLIDRLEVLQIFYFDRMGERRCKPKDAMEIEKDASAYARRKIKELETEAKGVLETIESRHVKILNCDRLADELMEKNDSLLRRLLERKKCLSMRRRKRKEAIKSLWDELNSIRSKRSEEEAFRSSRLRLFEREIVELKKEVECLQHSLVNGIEEGSRVPAKSVAKGI